MSSTSAETSSETQNKHICVRILVYKERTSAVVYHGETKREVSVVWMKGASKTLRESPDSNARTLPMQISRSSARALHQEIS